MPFPRGVTLGWTARPKAWEAFVRFAMTALSPPRRMPAVHGSWFLMMRIFSLIFQKQGANARLVPQKETTMKDRSQD